MFKRNFFVLSSFLLLGLMVFADVSYAKTKKKIVKKPASQVQKIKNKRTKHKAAFFGGYSRGVYSNSHFARSASSGQTTNYSSGSYGDAEEQSCEEDAYVSVQTGYYVRPNNINYNCNASGSYDILLARAKESCESKGCSRFRIGNMFETISDSPITFYSALYVCTVTGSCTDM